MGLYVRIVRMITALSLAFYAPAFAQPVLCQTTIEINDVGARVEVDGRVVTGLPVTIACKDKSQVIKITSSDNQVFTRVLPSAADFDVRDRSWNVYFRPQDNASMNASGNIAPTQQINLAKLDNTHAQLDTSVARDSQIMKELRAIRALLENFIKTHPEMKRPVQDLASNALRGVVDAPATLVSNVPSKVQDKAVPVSKVVSTDDQSSSAQDTTIKRQTNSIADASTSAAKSSTSSAEAAPLVKKSSVSDGQTTSVALSSDNSHSDTTKSAIDENKIVQPSSVLVPTDAPKKSEEKSSTRNPSSVVSLPVASSKPVTQIATFSENDDFHITATPKMAKNEIAKNKKNMKAESIEKYSFVETDALEIYSHVVLANEMNHAQVERSVSSIVEGTEVLSIKGNFVQLYSLSRKKFDSEQIGRDMNHGYGSDIAGTSLRFCHWQSKTNYSEWTRVLLGPFPNSEIAKQIVKLIGRDTFTVSNPKCARETASEVKI